VGKGGGGEKVVGEECVWKKAGLGEGLGGVFEAM
jgi:hypothetical protein